MHMHMCTRVVHVQACKSTRKHTRANLPSHAHMRTQTITCKHTLQLIGAMQDIRTHRLRALRSLPRLEHLNLGSSQRGSASAVNDRCMLELVCSLRSLKSLSLAHCVHLSDEGGEGPCRVPL